MSFPRLVLFLLLFAATSAVARAADEILAALESGRIRGERSTLDPSIRVFRGIPYARPARGELRWRPPVPPEPWTEILDCTRFGPICPQPDSPLVQGEVEDEDCLRLNVWAPADAPAPLPVMVWIHGGGFYLGSGSSALYEGTALSRLGVVLVSFNYRLGPLGFLAHPDLAKESEHGASGNYGLQDQIEVLRWVQQNIAAFGGDPGNVTIFGESAGGCSVGCLLISPLARGLFHRAIAQSGAAIWMDGHTTISVRGEPSAEEVGRQVFAELAKDAEEPLAAARAATVEAVLRAGKPGLFGTDGSSFSYAPVVDGWVIPDWPSECFAKGDVAVVPFLGGTNSDEGSMFTVSVPVTPESFVAGIHAAFPDLAEDFLDLYDARRFGSIELANAHLFGDFVFVGPTRAQARAMVAAGAPCYLYEFGRSPDREAGALHGAEIPYVFGKLGARGRAGPLAIDRQLSERMMRAWVQFATTGDPNPEGDPFWPRYDLEGDAQLAWGDTVEVERGPHTERLDLVDLAAAEQRGRRGH